MASSTIPASPLASAVDDSIVGIALELELRELPPHPQIKRIVQEEIGQQWTDDSAFCGVPLLRCSRVPSVFCTGSTKPPRNIQLHPWAFGVVCHSTLGQVMWNGIKESFDIQVNDPVCVPAALPCNTNRIERRLAGPIAVRVRMELRFHQRLQHHLHHGLCNARSLTVGMPRGRLPPLSFGISTSRTGGGK